MTKLSFSAASLSLALVALGGCSLLDAATAEKPNSDQLEGMGNAFVAAGTFGAMIDDPASVSNNDLAEMHLADPYKQALDPDGTRDVTLRTANDDTNVADCVTSDPETDTASWNCPLTFMGVSCTAVGSGSKIADMSYSGTSTLDCEGLFEMVLTAGGVFYNEESGSGGGSLTVNANGVDVARMTIENVTLCTDQDPPKPNGGRVTIDGLGPYEALPFDPLKVKFQGDPVCGTALIEE
jgi:hypothetical protein